MSLTELALLDGRRPLPLWDVIGLTLIKIYGAVFEKTATLCPMAGFWY
jgi:hypothetical protein